MNDAENCPEAVNLLGAESAYLYYPYIKNVTEYNLPPHDSLHDCALKTISSRNIDTGNSWSMAILSCIAVYKLVTCRKWRLCIFSSAIAIHAVIAFIFHAIKSYSKEIAVRWAKYDAIGIFITQFCIFFAYNGHLPWTLSIILCTAYGALIYNIIDAIRSLPKDVFAEPLVVKWMPIMISLFWVPVLISGSGVPYNVLSIGLIHYVFMGCILYMYLEYIPEKFTKTTKYGLSHEIFHIALWASFLFHYRTMDLLN